MLIAAKQTCPDIPESEVVFYDFDVFRLDVKRQEIVKNGEPVVITHKAFQVLHVLVQRFEQTVEKEALYKTLWGNSFVEDANLTQYIYVLRKALGTKPDGESYIETVPRSGYRFTARVKPIVSNYTVSPLGDSADSFTDSDAKSGSRTNKWIVIVSMASLFILVVIFTPLYVNKEPTETKIDSVRSVVILPFKRVGEGGQDEKLGLGMADAIIMRLSKVRRIPVRPTSAVTRYTDTPPTDSLTVGREMNVDSILEGTVQQEDGRIRISVVLINVEDGRSIWAEYFDENYTNIFAIQDSVSAKVARALEDNLTQN